MKTISERLKWARKRRGLSQYQLAALLKIRQPNIAKWETHHGWDPQGSTIQRLAKALEIDLHWLAFGRPLRGPLEPIKK